MFRKAFLMEVKDGMIDEYKKAHNPIWPELHVVLKKHGVHNYSIFYNVGTKQLLGYLEIDNETDFSAIAKSEICQRWWTLMKKYLVSETEDSSKAKEEELCEIFHID